MVAVETTGVALSFVLCVLPTPAKTRGGVFTRIESSHRFHQERYQWYGLTGAAARHGPPHDTPDMPDMPDTEAAAAFDSGRLD